MSSMCFHYLLNRRICILPLQGVPCAPRLGFVDLYFKCSTVCPTLFGLMVIWQNRLGSWARWWNTEIKVKPTQVYKDLGGPSPLSKQHSHLKISEVKILLLKGIVPLVKVTDRAYYTTFYSVGVSIGLSCTLCTLSSF